MPPVTVQNAQPSNLIDVIAQISEAFSEVADATPIMVGRHYLEHFGTGSAPRVLFVPEPAGRADRPDELGRPARMVHSCDVYVRGAESGDDITRFRSAYALSDRVIDMIETAGTGRIEWGSLADGSPTDVDAYGADVVFSFTYARDIAHDPIRWGLAPATADTSLPSPGVPPGGAASVDGIDVITIPKEEV